MNHFNVPKKIYFEKNSLQYLQKMENVDRVLLVACQRAYQQGFSDVVRNELAKRKNDVKVEVFVAAKTKQKEQIKQATEIAENFKADTVIGIGCAHAMSISKAISENIEKQIALIPIASINGDEVRTSGKHLADVVIVDGQFVAGNSSEKTASTGLSILALAIGSFLSEKANDYTKGFSLQAVKIVFENLERAVEFGACAYEQCEHLHNAAVVAGIAANNTQFSATLDEVKTLIKKKANASKVAEIENYVDLKQGLLASVNKLEKDVLK